MTLATRLLLVVALALTPPLVFGILNDVSQRQERADALNGRAVAESRALGDSLSLVAGGVQQLLAALAEAPAIRARDPAGCTAYLRAVSQHSEGYRLFAAIDDNGAVICNDAGSAPGSYSVADRAYFRRATQSGRFSSGDLVTSIVDSRRSIHFAMPFAAADGTRGGIVVAGIDRNWLAGQLAAETSPGGGQALVVDAGGVVVAAAQDGVSVTAGWIGERAPPDLLAAMATATPNVVELLGPDGRRRLFGAVPPMPMLAGMRAIVGIDRARAFADLRAASRRNLVGLGIGALVALLGSAFTARRFVLGPIAQITAAADRVAAGDLLARADLGRHAGEARELGASFDRMAASLAAREQARAVAETALRREEARLRLAVEAAELGTFEWDLRTDRVQRSERVRTMFGFAPDEGFTRQDYTDRMVGGGLGHMRRSLQAQISSGRVRQSYTILRDGRQRAIVLQAEIVRAAEGGTKMIGLLADETERLENVQALRDSEARFAAIANCIDQMVWSTRADGFHDYFNQRWYEFTGTEPGSSDGERWMGLFHPDDQAETGRIWAASLASGQSYHREYRLRHVSGQFRWVLGRAQAIHDEGGRIVRWYGTCTDIDDIVQARDVLARSREVLTREIADRTAELMAAEDQLRQSQKMEAVGQLTGGIAHDFNNMLQAIGGALELLVRRVDQGKLDDAKRFAGIARTTVDRAASLTQRLLAFARRQTLLPEPVDPAVLLDTAAELIGRTVGAAIDVTTTHGAALWPVLCDRNQLENVVFNLCINARDAMPAGGTLSIAAHNVALAAAEIVGAEGAGAGDYVEIAVTDDGAGMDEATQARAFEPFFTTKPLGQGTGLGLSQVYGFVRQSGGFVRLESAPGRGTSVRLYLPRHDRRPPPDAPDVPHAAIDSPAPAVAAPTLLLIGQDADTASHLRRSGFDVCESPGGMAAVQLLEGGLSRLDLLVTDVGLPGHLNGRQLAETARMRWPHLPVLFITFQANAAIHDGLAHDMAILAKPVPPTTLAAQIRTMLSAATAVSPPLQAS